MIGTLVLGVGRRPQFLPRWASPHSCPGTLTTQQLDSPQNECADETESGMDRQAEMEHV